MRFMPLQTTRPRPSCWRATTTRPPTLTSVSAPGLTEDRGALEAPQPDPSPPYVIDPHVGSDFPDTTTGACGSRAPHLSSPTGSTEGAGDPTAPAGSTHSQPASL